MVLPKVSIMFNLDLLTIFEIEEETAHVFIIHFA